MRRLGEISFRRRTSRLDRWLGKRVLWWLVMMVRMIAVLLCVAASSSILRGILGRSAISFLCRVHRFDGGLFGMLCLGINCAGWNSI